MDAVATARIPIEIKKQGDAILRAAGHTPTELINAAYQFVLDTGKLPDARETAASKAKERTVRALSAEQQLELEADLAAMTFAEPDAWKGLSFRELKEATWEDRYARFT